MFDLGAAVHDNLHAKSARPLGCLIVLNTELHPNDLRFWLERKRLVDSTPGSFGVTENIYHVDDLRNFSESFVKWRTVNAQPHEVWIYSDHMITLLNEKAEYTMGRPALFIRCADHCDGFHSYE